MSNTLEATENLGPIKLPRQAYMFRIQEEPKYEISNRSKQPMLVFQVEMVTPTIEIEGKVRDIAQLKMKMYCTLTKGKTFQLENLHRAADLPNLSGVQFNNESGLPENITYTGLEFPAYAQSEEQDQIGGDKKPILHPKTGEPLKSFQHRVGNIIV